MSFPLGFLPNSTPGGRGAFQRRLSLKRWLVRLYLSSFSFDRCCRVFLSDAWMTLSPVHRECSSWLRQPTLPRKIGDTKAKLAVCLTKNRTSPRGKVLFPLAQRVEEFFKDSSASSGTFLFTVVFYTCIMRGLHASEPCGGIVPKIATQGPG